MRFFKDYGYIGQPASLFETSEHIMPNTVVACCYNEAGMEAWGIFTIDGTQLTEEDVSPDIMRVGLKIAMKQAERHFYNHEYDIVRYIDEVKQRYV